MNKKFNPLVSIIIPVYNGSNYLKEAVDSALSQTYKNIEIIVINDGSNDNNTTETIAKSYGDKIRYFKKQNGGVSTALNFGIKKMTGEYFSWLSHDDLYYPNKIKKQIRYLRRQKDKDIILFSNYDYVDEQNNLIEKINIKSRVFTLDGRYVFLRKLINSLTLLIPVSAFKCGNEFDLEKKYTQDYDMWYRLLKKYKFNYVDFFASKTRLHKNQDSRISGSRKESDEFWLCIIKDYESSVFKDLFPEKIDFLIEIYNAFIYSDHEKTKSYLRKILSESKNMDHMSESLIYLNKLLKKRFYLKWVNFVVFIVILSLFILFGFLIVN